MPLEVEKDGYSVQGGGASTAPAKEGDADAAAGASSGGRSGAAPAQEMRPPMQPRRPPGVKSEGCRPRPGRRMSAAVGPGAAQGPAAAAAEGPAGQQEETDTAAGAAAPGGASVNKAEELLFTQRRAELLRQREAHAAEAETVRQRVEKEPRRIGPKAVSPASPRRTRSAPPAAWRRQRTVWPHLSREVLELHGRRAKLRGGAPAEPQVGGRALAYSLGEQLLFGGRPPTRGGGGSSARSLPRSEGLDGVDLALLLPPSASSRGPPEPRNMKQERLMVVVNGLRRRRRA